MLSQFLNLGTLVSKEDLMAPLPAEIQNAFVAEGIPIPLSLLPKDSILRESSSLSKDSLKDSLKDSGEV